jgi:hypothetical protein
MRRIQQELPLYIVIRLCTDDKDVHDYYHDVDKDVELKLDIVDDLRGEAKNIQRLNPWLTYTPFLQTIREAGTFCKLFDFIDERPLIRQEVAVCAQLLIAKESTPVYSPDPQAFLTSVELQLRATPAVYDGWLGQMGPSLNLDALRVVVHPSKHAIPGKMLRAFGLGDVAEWYYTGRKPDVWSRTSVENSNEGTADSAEGTKAVLEGTATKARRQSTFQSVGNRSFVAVAPMPGQRMEYYSNTKSRWTPCVVTNVDAPSGSIMIDVKAGDWISVEQQIGCMRQVRDPPCREPADPEGRLPLPPGDSTDEEFELCVGVDVQYRQTPDTWVSATVTDMNASTGAVMLSVNPGKWLTKERQLGCLRAYQPCAIQASLLDWRTDDVGHFLKRIELGHLVPKFRENGIDGKMLDQLSEDDLITELGCTKLQARKIRQRTRVSSSTRRAQSGRRRTT